MRRAHALSQATLAWTALTLAACGYAGAGASAGDDTELPNRFLAGETMQFRIHMGPIPVGEASLTVSEATTKADGTVADLVVQSRINSAGLSDLLMEIDDESTSVISHETGLPRATRTVAKYGKHRFSSDATFPPHGANNVSIAFTRPPAAPVHVRLAPPPGAMPHDMHTAMASLRPWSGTKGEARTLWVIGGRRLWKADVKWVGNEALATAFGARHAVRIDGTARRYRGLAAPERGGPERRFSVWLSDDGDRVPLRVEAYTEIADVVVDLVDYYRP